MADYQTAYQALGTHDEEEDADDNDIPVSEEYMIQVCPESSKSRWNHIEDLDDFFTRVYHYHQRSGFTCMAVEDLLQLVQFVFVALFSAFLASCVSYDVLFANVHYNTSHKVTISEAVIPLDQCVARLSPVTVICLLLACVTWLIRVIKVVYNIFKYFEIRSFYVQALKINAGDLPNMTWHEVQARLIEAQKEQQMCIHRKELTQLDIYHRILRFKNYIVAMANISLLPLKYNIPFLGEYAFLSTGLKYNLEFILFWGPWAPFENSWHLRNEYKSPRNRERLAQSLSTKVFWLGVLNLIFCPVVFVWQIIYSFFRYAELIKRQPSILGSRRWSNYARLTVRHFNELDHEFSARLNKGYQPMTDYLNIFTTPLVVIIAKNMVFFAGAIMAILLGLTVVDEDVLNVEHVLTIITLSGVCVTVCRSLIPPEHIIFSPELLLRNVAMAIHYMPDNWSGQAHTARVRDACTLLFQFKIVYILEELLSPLLTPLILIFCIRPHSAAIVDFFRRFTVEVVGVGDVCSFAQMDVKKHGNKEWQPSSQASPPKSQQANGGKTEMSLMHFHHTNPEWKPPEDCSEFINTFKGQVQRDIASRSMMPVDTQYMPSLASLSLGVPSLLPLQPAGPFTSMLSSFGGALMPPPTLQSLPVTTPSSGLGSVLHLRGAVSQFEGPVVRPSSSTLLGSLYSSGDSSGTAPNPPTAQVSLSHQHVQRVDECTRELMMNEMSVNALYMHELRWRRSHGNYLSVDEHARAAWRPPPADTVSGAAETSGAVSAGSPTSVQPMPDIVEEGSADERELDTSLIIPPPQS